MAEVVVAGAADADAVLVVAAGAVADGAFVGGPGPVGAGIDGREVGQRQRGGCGLRHLYASKLLSRGVSVKELADYLGHEDPGFTLRVYTHLLPSSHERARQAVDEAAGIWELQPDDGLQAA
ncbi:tyrosine-type recombinase/integrase [Nocardia sp. NPDC050710]|uniref:tyrosine-type recombinase/integrase n=1 Tax=Nocardia sp. NPDC050710 TaxID=3157220 RepID=UPI0033F54152